MKNLHLTDLFDMEILQRLQDTISFNMGIGTEITDENGETLTNHFSSCAFCSRYTKSTEEGVKRCLLSGKQGAEMVKQSGKLEMYHCHAGLNEFAVPIIVEGKFLGSVLGGQILTEPLPEEKVRAYAEELGIPAEEYIEAAKNIPIIPEEQLNERAEFMYNICDVFSQIAYKQYETMRVSNEVEREANMKSDFLANMSHEIRTPMNAVIGMAEMALREELPLAAREYVKQIMTSGKALLSIINDILDFSKIESGKMDINMVEYEPFSMIKDIASVIMTRIGDKELEFIVDAAPDIPKQLMGDSNRIRQVIINLANNAVKFTKEGCVILSVGYEKKSEREILLKVYVQDTGIGIKKEDLGKLFQSFQQVDSKRNRNVEGTGLGLAISKQLVLLMNGHIGVESEYEKGSRFFFEIPQFVLNDVPSVEVEEEETSKVAGLFCENKYFRKSMQKLFDQLQVDCVLIEKPENLKLLEERGAEFFFVENNCYSRMIHEYMAAHPQITGIRLIGFKEKEESDLENVIPVRKPLYAAKMAKILAHEALYTKEENEEDESFEFIAPDAEILIVDDNEPNLIVAKGILAPLQMNIDTASGGREAIKMIEQKHYDIVFMDHMMPEIDGIETTRIIRRFHKEYDSVPIIALTANVMEESQSLFLVEGMNDFVAKPIELKVIVAKLKQWLPQEKIQKVEGAGEEEEEKQERLENIAKGIDIPGLDIESALKLVGSETLFWQILKEYAKSIPKKSKVLQQHFEAENWKNYTIEAHALKSFSKQMGAMELSDLAAQMEKAGNNNDIDFITAHHDELIEKYRAYEPILAEYLEEDAEEAAATKEEYDVEKAQSFLDNMMEAIDNLDMDTMDEIVKQLSTMSLPEEQEPLFEQLQDAVEGMDVEACETIINEWKKIMLS